VNVRMYMYELREARVFQNPVALAAGVSDDLYRKFAEQQLSGGETLNYY
jgi:hypothetical protein